MIDVLYETSRCLAVNKPAGILTQAPPGIDSLTVRVKEYLTQTEEHTVNYLGVPHRLDRPVSGVILFGKDSRTTRFLSEQFEARQIAKTYWAVVSGSVQEKQGTLRNYIRKVPDKALAEVVPPIQPDAREAILHYKVLKHFELDAKPFTLLEIKLETGRMHQIRLQLSVFGFPILGDATYGSEIPFGEHFDDERQREIALHSRSISFCGPGNKETVSLTAPLPDLWKSTGLPS
ncbi:MAG: RNA pseudouridine synthase [Planctomycetaceae bacterium]|nr:RNA pseudouridine synthase [Planctomycetaceae bacterium]